MIKIVMYVLIIAIVLFGMVTIITELYHHFRYKKKMTKSSLRWILVLLFIGCTVLIDKVQYLFNI